MSSDHHRHELPPSATHRWARRERQRRRRRFGMRVSGASVRLLATLAARGHTTPPPEKAPSESKHGRP